MKRYQTEYEDLPSIKKPWNQKRNFLLGAILALLLSLTFVCLVILLALRWNCYNSDAIYRSLALSNYYDKVLQEIENNAEVITKPTGLPLEVLEGVILAPEVYQDINIYIDNLYGGEEFQSNKEAVRARLQYHVSHYLEEKNIVPDRVQTQTMDQFIEAVTDVYHRSVKIPLMKYFITLNNRYQTIYFLSVGVCVSIILIIIIMLYQLSPSITRFYYYMYNGNMAATLMLAVFPLWLLLDKFDIRLRITPASLHGFMIEYFNANLHTFLGISVFFGVLSMVFLFMERKLTWRILNRFSVNARKRIKN